jgi:2-amino-4-hydroxy-6-hydroxymethyldihydropteridine diphosphokinase
VIAVVSLGTNLGDRAARLRCGLEVLGQHLAVRKISPIYETEPVGVSGQPAFLNAVALLDSDDPECVFTAAQSAEQSQGRLRTQRWGARSLDVDVISVDSIVSEDPRLTLPHPRARERGFVLVPWLAVDETAWLPRVGAVRSILAGLAPQDVRRVGDPLPLP